MIGQTLSHFRITAKWLVDEILQWCIQVERATDDALVPSRNIGFKLSERMGACPLFLTSCFLR